MYHDEFGDQFAAAAAASAAPDYSAYIDTQVVPTPPVDPNTTIKSDIPPKSGWLTDYIGHGVFGGLERGVRQVVGLAVQAEAGVEYLFDTVQNKIVQGGAYALGYDLRVPTVQQDGTVKMDIPPELQAHYRGDENVHDLGIDKPFIGEAERGGAKLVQTLAAFAVPFKAAKVGLGAVEALSSWGRVGAVAKDIMASASVAFSSLDPMQKNLANLAQDYGLDHTAVAEYTHVGSLIDALSVDADDSVLEARLKNAATDIALNGAVLGIASGIKYIRNAKVTKAAVEASQEAEGVAIPHTETAIAQEVSQAAKEGTMAMEAEAAPSISAELPKPEEAPASTTLSAKAPSITTPEQMLSKMEKLSAKITDEEIAQLADQFNKSASFDGIERIGVNPARLDMTKWLADKSNPEEMKAALEDVLHRISSSDVGKRLASALGSRPRSDQSAALLARMIGGDVTDVVSSLKAKTQNIDVWVRAASAMVGGEAAKLVEAAKNLQALEKTGEFAFDNPAHPAYVEFLKQFETLTTLQSAMRGSFSEMGRGLRSIQGINAIRKTNAGLDTAKQVLGEEAANAAEKAVKKTPKEPKQSWEDILRSVGDAETPAQRKKLMERVIQANGDLARVAQNVASGEGTLAAKAARWVRETSANLFSVGTATATGMGMVTYHSFDAIAGLVNHPLALLTKSDEYLVGAAANRAKWSALSSAYLNGLVRSVQVSGSAIIKEVGRVADGVGLKGSEKAAEIARAWETKIGQAPVLQGDKFGKNVLGSVTHKFDRPDVNHQPAIYLSTADLDALAEQANHGPAIMAAAARTIVGGVVNGFGAATRTGRILTIEALDELTGSAVYGAHRYAEAVALATRQGIEQGLSGKALHAFAENTAKNIVGKTSADTAAELQNLIEAGGADPDRIKMLAKDVITRHGIEEVAQEDARRILFQDQLQTGIGKKMKRAAQAMDPLGIVAPFVHTPLRILETSLMDFSPIGLVNRQLWADLRSGNYKAAEALTKIGMGTAVMLMGYSMAADGTLVGYDGGPQSSSRLARPQYSMKVGDKWVEYGRIDPLATVIGAAADLFQFERALELQSLRGDPDAGSKLENYASAVWSTIVSNITSKTYLQGLKNFAGMFLGQEGPGPGFKALIQGLEQRLVPLGGIQKGVASEITDSSPQTSDPTSYLQELRNNYVSSWFFAKDVLWEKRDPFLGQVMSYDRDVGIKVADHDHDALFKALGDLAFKIPRVPTSINGVKLTGDQQHRLLQLMGDTQVGGKNLADTLREYVSSPDWATYNDNQKQQLLVMVRQAFYENAKTQLLSEDRGLFKGTMVAQFQRQMLNSGASPEQIGNSVAAFRKELDSIQ